MSSENKNMALEQIAAAIAHEVKNPITLVRANIDLLQSKDSYGDSIKNYEIIKKELDKINDIMMDFITLTKPAEEENDLLYLYDIVKDIIQSYTVTHGHRINFELNTANKDLTILGNEKNLKILLGNLIKNAVESMKNSSTGTISIHIYENNSNLITEIRDTGCGIHQDIKEKIFDDFFTTKPTGSGLGLAICRKICTEHGGTISLSDNTPKGTISTVSLPIYNTEQ